jgi:protein-tyrosine phosphatase
MVRVCFVCLGNICRSPTAEGVMRKLVDDAGLVQDIEVTSAGTAAYHAGERADSRAAAAARGRQVVLSGRAKQVTERDFEDCHYILAMDASNMRDLERLAPSAQARKKIHLLREFDPASPRGAAVPDPYYGGDEGFEEVLDLCEAACRGLLAHIRKEHRL